MDIYVIGVNYKTTPIDIREKFSIDEQEYEHILSELSRVKGVSECALLSTCNRTEIHAYSDGSALKTENIELKLCELKGINLNEVKKYFYVYGGMEAVKHIIKVASGMDSMVLGEDQILGQFKKAYEISMKEEKTKAVLNTLSRLAITSSKKIKTRNIDLNKASSIATQVSFLLEGIYADKLQEKRVLLIGSGEMCSLVFEELSKKGISGISMTKRNRNPLVDNSKEEFKINYVNYNDRYSMIDESDIVIGATSSPHYTITKDELEKVIINRNKERVYIDLAVPRDFDESISEFKNIQLFNVDDLKNISLEKKTGSNLLDIDYIYEQMNIYTEEFTRWFKYRSCVKEV